MFKSLKDKLKGWFGKAEPVEEVVVKKPVSKPKPVVKKEVKVEKPVKKEKVKKSKEVIDSERKTTEKVVKDMDNEGISIEGPEGRYDKSLTPIVEEIVVEEEVKKEKKGFFKSIGEKFTHTRFSEDYFLELFNVLELILLENNVALSVVDSIRVSLHDSLVGNDFKKSEIPSALRKALRDAIDSLLLTPDFDIISKIKSHPKGKPFVVLFLGINGSGKCVHKDSNIQLSNGDILKIGGLYEHCSKSFKEQIVNDGKIINISSSNLLVPSFNRRTGRIEHKRATHLWKLKKKELLEIKLNCGNDYSIKVTPEHPFFVLKNGKITKVRGDELNETDIIATPRKISIKGSSINFLDKMKKLNFDAFLTSDEMKKSFLNNRRTLKDLCQHLKFKRNYCQFTTNMKNGQIPLELLEDQPHIIKVKSHRGVKPITIPTYLNCEWAEFLGYIVGDGHIEESYIEISNEDPEIIERLKVLSHSLFGFFPTIRRDERTNNLHRIIFSSATIVDILGMFKLKPGKKGKSLMIPKEILLSNDDVIKSFIRAYFDCGSHASKNVRQIELTSESNEIIKQMSMLLKRFQILSTISEKFVGNVPYWRLSIRARYAEAYAEKIGYLIKKKRERAGEYHKIGLTQGSGKQDMIILGNELKKLRENLGFSLQEIQRNAVNGYEIYEKKGVISRMLLGRLLKFYELKRRGLFHDFLLAINEGSVNRFKQNVTNGVCTTLRNRGFIAEDGHILKDGVLYLNQINNSAALSREMINNLKIANSSEISWAPIKEISIVENDTDFVYDLTVEDNHSFIADGFIVHNTTSLAKFAHLLKKNNLSSVLAAGDTFRAASMEQLSIHADKLGVKMIKQSYGSDPAAVAFDAVQYAKSHNIPVVLIDTAGRMHTKDNLMKELEKIVRVSKPDFKFFVGESITGNDATLQAEAFNNSVGIDGIILTKADVDPKGGTALSVGKVTNRPIFFLGMGQDYDSLVKLDKNKLLDDLGL